MRQMDVDREDFCLMEQQFLIVKYVLIILSKRIIDRLNYNSIF